MLKKVLTILALIIVVMMCICVSLSGFRDMVIRGFMDFPCFVGYDSARQCLDTSLSYVKTPEETQIEVFLTTYSARFRGGGCFHEDSPAGSVTVTTPAGKFTFERSGETLLVNGKPLAPGETFKRASLFYSHPWEIAFVEFRNMGVSALCDHPSAAPRLLVVGGYGTRLSVPKGAFLSLVLLIALVCLALSLRRRRPKAV